MKLLYKNKRINRNNNSMFKMFMTSLISIGICVICFLGTTFAWFTDTVSTGKNTIKAGNFDVDLVDQAGNSLEGNTTLFVGKL